MSSESPMVHIPAGPFSFGVSESEKESAAREAGVHPQMLHFHSEAMMLTTPDFWIDRHPVTRGQFLYFMEETDYEIEYSGWLVGWIELVDCLGTDDAVRCFRQRNISHFSKLAGEYGLETRQCSQGCQPCPHSHRTLTGEVSCADVID